MSKVKILLFLLNLFLFIYALPVETFAGDGTLRVQILELTVASYADSGSVPLAPTASGGFTSIKDCNSGDYIGGSCVDFIRNPQNQNQIIVISVRNVIPGNYNIEAERSGYQKASASFTVTSASENSQTDGEITLVSNTETTLPIPKITEPGIITRATTSTFEVTNFSESSLLASRYVLELVDQSGTRFDCQEVRPDSGSNTTAHVNLHAPTDNLISQVSLRLFRTNSRNTGTPACDDITGQSPLDSVSAFLSKPAGGAATQVLFKYDKATNSCNPDTSGEPLDECEKRIIKSPVVPP